MLAIHNITNIKMKRHLLRTLIIYTSLYIFFNLVVSTIIFLLISSIIFIFLIILPTIITVINHNYYRNNIIRNIDKDSIYLHTETIQSPIRMQSVKRIQKYKSANVTLDRADLPWEGIYFYKVELNDSRIFIASSLYTETIYFDNIEMPFKKRIIPIITKSDLAVD